MKTQREATYLLKNALAAGAISDDFSLSGRRLLTRLKALLTQLKHRNLSKGIDFDNESIFTYDCISLEELDRISCPTIPPSGITWKRSVKPIPSFIE